MKKTPAPTTMPKAAARFVHMDWKGLIKASPEECRKAIRSGNLSRTAILNLVARRAYETAPIGGEVAAIWKAIKDFPDLESGEVYLVGLSLPSRRVMDDLWSFYHPISKRKDAEKERQELVRRRRNLAKMEAAKKPAKRARKGGTI